MNTVLKSIHMNAHFSVFFAYFPESRGGGEFNTEQCALICSYLSKHCVSSSSGYKTYQTFMNTVLKSICMNAHICVFSYFSVSRGRCGYNTEQCA